MSLQFGNTDITILLYEDDWGKEMNLIRDVLAIGLTGGILLGLSLLTHPSGPALSSITGSEEVSTAEEATFEVTVETRADERPDVGSLSLVFETANGERAVARSAVDGTVLDVQGSGDSIDISRLERTLRITNRLGGQDGYGYESDARPTAFAITVDAGSFEPGEYTVTVRVRTGDGSVITSSAHTFAVEPS